VGAGMICGVPPSPPSYEDLVALVALQAQQISELEGLAGDLERLRVENAELRRQLGTNSTHTSRPPSSDGLYGKPSALRGRSGGKPGTQRGEPGVTLYRART
jgi:transposase